MTRTLFIAVLLSVSFFSSIPANAETRVLFSSQESVEKKLIQLINDSSSSIEMALFELRSPELVSVLKRAQERGVRLRLVLDASHRTDAQPCGEVRWLGGKTPRGRGVMHNKFALFDRSRTVTGSYNWTPGAEYSNYENALLTDDPGIVRAYANEFETLWHRAIQDSSPRPSSTSLSHRERVGVRQHRKQQRIETIKIRVSKPVTKRRRKSHTIKR